MFFNEFYKVSVYFRGNGKLIEIAKREKYYDISKNESDALKAKISHNIDQDLEHFKKEISEMMTDEIVSRYYYQKGAIKAALKEDQDVEKALEILHKPEIYTAIFSSGRIIKAN